jgi:hypothetical protein
MQQAVSYQHKAAALSSSTIAEFMNPWFYFFTQEETPHIMKL